MNVKFKDGTIFNCSTPTEQKIFKAESPAGWILGFYLIYDITSVDIDKLLTDNNISELTFTSEENKFILSGYNRVSSVIIRHSTEKEKSKVEIQLIKGV